jgi:hypothetical protein
MVEGRVTNGSKTAVMDIIGFYMYHEVAAQSR